MSLSDLRVSKLAKLLVGHCTQAKKGDRAIIAADYAAKPLVKEVYKELLLAGASEIRVHYDFEDQWSARYYSELNELFYKYATPQQLSHFPKTAFYEIKNSDVWIAIRATPNTRGLTNIDSYKISKRSLVVRPLINWRVEKTRWVITNFPVETLAQEADMSLADYEDFVYGATIGIDWNELYKKQEKLRKIIDSVQNVRIIGKDTDIALSIKGRKAENGAGQFNMPDGEVFTSVVEDSAQGVISYTYPALYSGKEFHDVRLKFKDGKVVSATASKGEGDLNKILNIDKGGRYIGELGFGNNFKIKKFTKDILFDEKIGGTIHIALGKGYKETLSKNISALHWDMICDLRGGRRPGGSGPEGGELWFDKKLVQKDGRWLIQL